jgi:hypothetical protein
LAFHLLSYPNHQSFHPFIHLHLPLKRNKQVRRSRAAVGLKTTNAQNTKDCSNSGSQDSLDCGAHRKNTVGSAPPKARFLTTAVIYLVFFLFFSFSTLCEAQKKGDLLFLFSSSFPSPRWS